MRIRIIQTPTEAEVDGMDLRHFKIDCEYVVGNRLGALMLAEAWAEPVADDDPALVVPLKKRSFEPEFRNPARVAADRPRTRRKRR